MGTIRIHDEFSHIEDSGARYRARHRDVLRAKARQRLKERVANDSEFNARRLRHKKETYQRHKRTHCDQSIRWAKRNKVLLEHRRRERHERNKRKAIDALGGKCLLCGYTGHIAAMEFHHVDPSTKRYRLALHLSSSWPWERLWDEIRKCVLLCGNCHAIVEWEKKRGVDLLKEKHNER